MVVYSAVVFDVPLAFVCIPTMAAIEPPITTHEVRKMRRNRQRASASGSRSL
ncbi:MAG: hypothetical protein ACYCSX_07550 [Acidimicrobiales bacterium]